MFHKVNYKVRRLFLNPTAVGEPVKLPITKKDGISYVDIESEPAMLGVSYTKIMVNLF